MNSINKLTVKYHGKRVGELSLLPDNSVCTFQYDRQWLSEGFSISPLDLPLKSGQFIAKREPFWGNFGIFEDSLPDGYGRYLLNRTLKKKGIDELKLNPLERLSIIGSSGMGALSYEPVNSIDIDFPLPDFDDLQQMAFDVLSEKDDSSADLLYFNSGNSGGCRPKCLYRDDEGSWIVKFRHIYDPQDMGKMEFEFNQKAQNCGIKVPDFKLIEGKYFASRRFDISNGERLHVATAGALLNESIFTPKLDYKVLLHLTGYLTQDSKQVEQMFRLMVFNVLADNKDDHAKNFSFIYCNGKWSLAPAYDLTFSPEGYHGQHATSVNFNGNPTIEDMLSVSESIRIKRKRGQEIIEEVKNGLDIL